MSTVPFGKYKGRPVEDMLADADYMPPADKWIVMKADVDKLMEMRPQ